ncbi:polyprenyl synthetase [Halobacteriales archaeon QH_10_70_21]|nr:MAG: polyprenyl synthetase [Halobacteriales archaeon QH_10_70_21]
MHSVLDEWRPVVDETIESLLPRTVDEAYLTELFGEATYAYDPTAVQQALADPIWDLLDRGGKRWRAVLFLLLVDAFGEAPETYLEYATIPEVLHNGTIIVDDVEDGATHRRGSPALHHVHGTDVALNAGNAMYFLPLKVLARDPGDLPAERRLAAYEMLTHELNRTHLGQGMDIRWHNDKEGRVSEAEYLEMCACKTVAFQIADDVLDVEHAMVAGGEFGKGAGNDVREGKKTLMVIHAAEHAEPSAVARLEELLWAEENTDDEVREAIDILETAGSVEYARGVAEELATSAKGHLEGLDLEPEPAAKLAGFADFVVQREV